MNAVEREPARILVVDDDEAHAEALADALEMDGYRCDVADGGAVMTDRSGLDVLKESKQLLPDAVVLLITGHASVETAVDAMRHGAEDYLPKPVNISELRAKLTKAIEKVRLRADNQELMRQNQELRRQLDKRFGFEGILGHSPQMLRVFEVLGQVAPTAATVLILGESGTGKELVAAAVHQNSPRAGQNFVAVNCAAMSEGLIESGQAVARPGDARGHAGRRQRGAQGRYSTGGGHEPRPARDGCGR